MKYIHYNYFISFEQQQIMHYNDFSIDNIIISKIMPQNGINIASLIYNDANKKSKIIIQTDPINLTYYGIPSLNRKYNYSDKQREYIGVPLDSSQISCRDL